MVQQVKDLALSLLWGGFVSWPRNFYRLWHSQKKKKKAVKYKNNPWNFLSGGGERIIFCYSQVEPEYMLMR